MRCNKIILSILFLGTSLYFGIKAQAQVSITNDGSLPHPSSMLDVKSFTKGMLLPRTSTISRLAIVNPASD
jgi:hypothetical protein